MKIIAETFGRLVYFLYLYYRNQNKDIMKPTVKELRSIYNEFNTKYFNDELPKWLPLEVSGRLTRALGKAYGRKIYDRCGNVIGVTPERIKISTRREFVDLKQVANVMCHEMVHIWQFINNKADGHGYWFCYKAGEIKKIDPSMIITETHNSQINGECNLEKSDATIIVWNYKGKFLYAKTKPEKIQYFLDDMANWLKETSVFGVFSANGARWTRIRNSITTLTYYTCSEAYFMSSIYPTLIDEINIAA